MKKFISRTLCLILAFSLSGILSLNIFATLPKTTHNIPSRMKIGDTFFDKRITFNNLTPGKYAWLDTVGFDEAYSVSFNLHLGGDHSRLVDENGSAIYEELSYLSSIYQPGSIALQPIYSYDTNQTPTPPESSVQPPFTDYLPHGEPITTIVEEPIIATNAPNEIVVGSTFDFTTALTNTALTNQKVSIFAEALTHDNDRNFTMPIELAHIPAFRPVIEIVEGKDKLKQSNQDYTNTLSTSEKLVFDTIGTVSFKITYKQINTCGMCLLYENGDTRYNPTQTITINVVNPPKPESPSTSIPATPSTPTSTPSTSTSQPNPAENPVTSVIDDKPVVIKDDKTGIKMGANIGVIPIGTTLITNINANEELNNKVKITTKDIATKFTLYDIALENNGNKIQPTSKVSISIPIPNDFDKTRVSVFYINENGEPSEIISTVVDNDVNFETDKFSATYAIAETIIATTESVSSTTSDTTSNPNTTEKNKSNLFWIFLSVALVVIISSGVALWYFKYRKPTNDFDALDEIDQQDDFDNQQ